MMRPLTEIPAAFHSGHPKGITSVCSAHPLVIEAALRLARDTDEPALIEATCNQVNQDGGYTGMTPADFRRMVEAIADKVDLPFDRIILGGDHLGPNPWKILPTEMAMNKAEAMIAAYAEAGFTKLHLDTSMGCTGEPMALPDEITAERAARLAAVAETHASGLSPVYVIGTEVPVPGGALEEIDRLKVTTPEAVVRTHEIHRRVFAAKGLTAAFSRVIALVVQPGVEFGHSNVVHFDPDAARALSASLKDLPGIVFEAHSTDYQSGAGLAALVRNGFAILKVGPWLTFALREALYGLDALADAREGHAPESRLMSAMEAIMIASPDNWKRYYSGTKAELWLQRHFSYSDRIRYYWPHKAAVAAVAQLRRRLEARSTPEPLISQYLPRLTSGIEAGTMDDVLIASIQQVLQLYAKAVRGDR